MANVTDTQKPFLVLIVFAVLFVAIFYGTRAFADYNMMKKALDKVEFLEQNNAPHHEVCSALNWALDVSKQVQNQKQYDTLTQRMTQKC